MLRRLVGNRIEKILMPVGSILYGNKITPNILTLAGLSINVVGAYLYYEEQIVVAGIVILFAGTFDMLDGVVARAGSLASKIGAFTDSVVDRYSDFIILSGILALFAKQGDLRRTLLVLFVMCGSFLISYVRARAELLIEECDVGLMERPERIIALALGSILGFFQITLWFLAISTHLTALYRIYYTYKIHKRAEESRQAPSP